MCAFRIHQVFLQNLKHSSHLPEPLCRGGRGLPQPPVVPHQRERQPRSWGGSPWGGTSRRESTERRERGGRGRAAWFLLFVGLFLRRCCRATDLPKGTNTFRGEGECLFANANVVVCVAILLARAVYTSWKNASGGVNFQGLFFASVQRH